ncbi:MAG: hypothetical protein JXK07_12175 [Spirochaetes bacterium]|nr:hypothetical protein [Spirochaetota bacterium]MBN2770401.1 hypothetical protein [Spirochaetota bacterium]
MKAEDKRKSNFSIKTKIANTKIQKKLIISLVFIISLFLSANIYLKVSLGLSGKIAEDLYQSVLISKYVLETQNRMNTIQAIYDDCIDYLYNNNFTKADLVLSKQAVSELDDFNKNIIVIKEQLNNESSSKLIFEAENFVKDYANLFDNAKSNIALENAQESIYSVKRIQNHIKNYNAILDMLKTVTEKSSAQLHNLSLQKNELAQKASTSLLLFSLFTGILISIIISKSILKSISLFHDIFSKGSSGDLNSEYPANENSNNEFNSLGIMFNNFLSKTNSVIKQVKKVSDELSFSSNDLADTTSAFSENTQSQAATSEQITATLEEVAAGINSISENTIKQHGKLIEVIKLMDNLSEEIDIMENSITDTRNRSVDIAKQAKKGNDALKLMSSSISEIASSSNEVTEIIQIIGNISSEINLLSLNAAIEAARAGESGKGFAVVADEISKLADQTASSISQISELIEKNNDEISKGMHNINETISGISKIIASVESIDNMMNTIITDVKKQQDANKYVNVSIKDLNKLTDEVKFAIEEQRTAATEIMNSMTSINNMIQSDAASAEEIAGNTENLSDMAERLKTEIQFFKLKEKTAV